MVLFSGIDSGFDEPYAFPHHLVTHQYKQHHIDYKSGHNHNHCVHEASKADPSAFILDYALGANIYGVITTAILTGIYITLLS